MKMLTCKRLHQDICGINKKYKLELTDRPQIVWQAGYKKFN